MRRRDDAGPAPPLVRQVVGEAGPKTRKPRCSPVSAALCRTEAIAWHLDTDDAFWARMYDHFTEPQLVELGCMIGLTLGQQSWLRLLNIEHHQVLPGTDASMAPGFETADALARSKSAEEYWARPSSV